MSSTSFFTCGVFGEAHKHAEDFYNNLLLSMAMSECVLKLTTAEKQYKTAILQNDNITAERKRLEIEACKLSLQFTANFLDNVDEINK